MKDKFGKTLTSILGDVLVGASIYLVISAIGWISGITFSTIAMVGLVLVCSALVQLKQINTKLDKVCDLLIPELQSV